jgi:pyruvate/2-oxoglutarate/acetoin dehydrogenase E1 component
VPNMRTREAVIAALGDELARDPSVVLLGEDIADAGGAFKATEGLKERFGGSRVRDTPISEMAFLGAAVGAAATGLRPVVEMMFIEFIGVALDQLTTEASKFRFLSRGKLHVPLTVRASAGAGLGFGCQHSQMLDQWFRGTSGLKVVVPSSPQTTYGLLRAAIQDDDPVVVLETRSLYGDRGMVVTGEDGIIPLGRAATIRSGSDLTVVSLGQMVKRVEEAAEGAAWNAEIIDLQTLVPWDREAVLASVAKTRRLVVVEESPYSGGWGSEIAAHVSQELFGELLAPIFRICLPDAPIPYAASLESRYLPDSASIRSQIDRYIDSGKPPRPWWLEEGLVQAT